MVNQQRRDDFSSKKNSNPSDPRNRKDQDKRREMSSAELESTRGGKKIPPTPSQPRQNPGKSNTSW